MRAAPTRTQQQQQQAGAASAMASESWPSQRAVINVSVPLALAVFGSAARLLTVRGACAGLVVGVIIIDAGYDCAAILAAFFLLGSLVSKVGARRKDGVTPGDGKKADAPAARPRKRGRDEWQVASTAGVPAALCLARHLGVPAQVWHPAFVAFFACAAGDTFASELGVLAAQTPRSILSLQAVQRGQDGGVTFAGTAASVLGGALVGVWAFLGDGSVGAGDALSSSLGPAARVVGCAALGGLWGGVGSALDSVGGALLQPDLRASHRHPARWKMLNNVVNVASSAVTAAIATLVARVPVLQVPMWLALGMCALALAPITVFTARKLLHIFTSVLVLAFARHQLLVVGVAVITLVLLFTCRGLLARFESDGGASSPGIAVYTVATGCCAWFAIDPFYVLGPMMFADPMAAIIGSNMASRRIWGNKKTLAGSLACWVTCALWLAWLASDHGRGTQSSAMGLAEGMDSPTLVWRHVGSPCGPGAVAVAATVLTITELVSGSWDNASLPLVAMVLSTIHASMGDAS